TRGLGAAYAEKPGPDECARPPGGGRPGWGDGYGHDPRHRQGGTGCRAVGQIAGSSLPKERRRNCQTVEWPLAGGPSVQPGAGFKDARCHPGKDRRLWARDSPPVGRDGARGVPWATRAEVKNAEGQGHQTPRRRTLASGPLPDERRGPDWD